MLGQKRADVFACLCGDVLEDSVNGADLLAAFPAGECDSELLLHRSDVIDLLLDALFISQVGCLAILRCE